MNISASIVSGQCIEKCTYLFNYPTSNCVATNKTYYISISYDATAASPVKFNNDNYNVKEIIIVSPSIHEFNGEPVEGELIINHIPLGAGSSLYVCIPIVSGGLSTKATPIIEEIISAVAHNSPKSNEQTIVNVDEFTLNSFVQLYLPFYNYSTPNKSQFIVYGINEAINISPASITDLINITAPGATETNVPSLSELFVKTDKNGNVIPFFVNPNGASNSEINNGEIYIDCRPTGSSEETTGVITSKSTVKNDFSPEAILNSPIVFFLLSLLFAVIFLVLLFLLINRLSTGSFNVKSITSKSQVPAK
jgi:hypothetical protein